MLRARGLSGDASARWAPPGIAGGWTAVQRVELGRGRVGGGRCGPEAGGGGRGQGGGLGPGQGGGASHRGATRAAAAFAALRFALPRVGGASSGAVASAVGSSVPQRLSRHGVDRRPPHRRASGDRGPRKVGRWRREGGLGQANRITRRIVGRPRRVHRGHGRGRRRLLGLPPTTGLLGRRGDGGLGRGAAPGRALAGQWIGCRHPAGPVPHPGRRGRGWRQPAWGWPRRRRGGGGGGGAVGDPSAPVGGAGGVGEAVGARRGRRRIRQSGGRPSGGHAGRCGRRWRPWPGPGATAGRPVGAAPGSIRCRRAGAGAPGAVPEPLVAAGVAGAGGAPLYRASQ